MSESGSRARREGETITMQDRRSARHGGGGRIASAFPRYDAARARAASQPYFDDAPLASSVELGALRAVAVRERALRWRLACADALAATAAVVVAIPLVGGDRLRLGFLIVAPLIILAAKIQGLYDHDDLVIHKSTLDEFPRLVNLATLFALVTWLARHYVVVGAPGTLSLLALWLTMIGGLALARATARVLVRDETAAERLLLVGSSAVRDRLESKLAGEPRATLVGTIGIDSVARDPGSLRRVAAQLGAHRVMIALSDHADSEATMDVVRCAMGSGLRVSLLPNSIGAVGGSVAFDDLGGMPVLGVPHFGLSRSSRAIKRTVDLVGASFALLAFAPLMALLAIAVKRDTPGPVLFRQTRVGRDGQPFKMLKFRSMVDGADAMKDALREHNDAGDIFKIHADPRITRVGRILRRTGLDELPQLFNVLRGDMSLVGPRPLVLDEDKRVTGYDRRRLHLTPGMTGRWQVLGSARIPLSEMVKIDYLYVANWSVWNDLKILLQTVGFMVGRRGL